LTSLVRRLLSPGESRSQGISLQQWADSFQYGGTNYGVSGSGTLTQSTEDIGSSFQGYVDGAYKSNGVVFACNVARMLLFSEARFQYQRMRGGRPGELFGDPSLRILETPWPNGTTADLLSRMMQDADLAGNSYTARLSASRLTRMRPDWVTIMLGSNRRDWQPGDLDTEVIGYLYHPGGHSSTRDPIPLLPENVAHFAPIPDPVATYRGMSWLTPIVREIMGDKSAMEHKLRYFEGGATVNLVATLPETVKDEAFKRWVATFKQAHEGRANAYETVFLGAGAKLEAIGSDMKQIDFKTTQGHGETRIAAAAGVPPIIVGLSEGLEAATYSNYGQARRRFADGTMRPNWRQAAGALATIVPSKGADTRLWYDARDVPFLQEDVKDEADIQQVQASTIGGLVREGFTPASAVVAVLNGDMSLLEHTGLVSVQLLPPGSAPDLEAEPPAPVIDGANGRRLLTQYVTARN
jgi:phage portal protein BeeE